MRFNNRACALMDIPDLPQGAFEHIGDRKIKPQGGGGGGGIVSAITNPISSVLGTDGGGGGILGAVEDVGQAIGGGLADVDKFVNQNLPGGWISPALISGAVAAPYLAPALAAEGAGAAAFTGATETGLATLASEAAVADTVGAALLSGAAETAAAEAVTQALPYTLAADASNLAANGFSEATIAQNLTASGVDSFVAADTANLAAQGLSSEQIAQTLSYSYTPAELAGTGIESKALGAASKFALSPSQALQAARLGMGLLGGRPQQRMPQMPQMGGSYGTSKPGGVVDYSGLYNLLALQRPKNPNSLLG